MHAAAIYNSLNEFRVRTESGDFHRKICASAFKIAVFRAEFLEKAQPEELAVLAEFLAQEEFAEEVLQEAYDGSYESRNPN